ncbi:MAG TPA: autotransporter-associated beta strand repeat-containing protein [Rudaea sp.]
MSALPKIWVVLAAACLLLAAASLRAQQTYVWTGATSGDWNTATNWNPNGVPGGSAVQGGNPEDVAEFDASARTAVSISASVELGAISFAYGPPYSFQLNGWLQLRHGILNLSTTTQNTFTTSPGTLSFEQDGDAANSLITNNNGNLAFYGTSSAGSAQITNNAGATIYFSNSSSGAGAVVYNGGTIDYSYMTAPSSLGAVAGGVDTQLLLGSQTLSIGALNYTQTIDGSILDGGFDGGSGGALTKVGSGILQLTGTNGYTGKTTVAQGLLEVDSAVASPEVLVETGASVAGTGPINGSLAAQAGSTIFPGNVYNPSSSPPNTPLTVGKLFCAPSPTVFTRIGNVGSATHGNYLVLNSSLQQGFCPHLHFSLASAGVPLSVGSYYLLILIQGSTDYSAANIDFDFNYFAGYTQATGAITIASLSSVTAIYLHLTDPGDRIFKSDFD